MSHTITIRRLTEALASLTLSSVVLEAGIYISHIVWRIRYRKLRKEAKETGNSIEDLLAMPTQRDNPRKKGDLEAGVLECDGSKDIDPGSTTAQSPTVPCVERSEMSEK